MTQRVEHSNQEVIDGLRTCAGDSGCGGCPWRGTALDCEDQLKREAADLIVELTVPRRLGREELSSWIKPVWFEISADEDGEGAWRGWALWLFSDEEADTMIFSAMGKDSQICADISAYGRTWICWSLEPAEPFFGE